MTAYNSSISHSNDKNLIRTHIMQLFMSWMNHTEGDILAHTLPSSNWQLEQFIASHLVALGRGGQIICREKTQVGQIPSQKVHADLPDRVYSSDGTSYRGSNFADISSLEMPEFIEKTILSAAVKKIEVTYHYNCLFNFNWSHLELPGFYYADLCGYLPKELLTQLKYCKRGDILIFTLNSVDRAGYWIKMTDEERKDPETRLRKQIEKVKEKLESLGLLPELVYESYYENGATNAAKLSTFAFALGTVVKRIKGISTIQKRVPETKYSPVDFKKSEGKSDEEIKVMFNLGIDPDLFKVAGFKAARTRYYNSL